MYKRIAVSPLCLNVDRLVKTEPLAVVFLSAVALTALTFLCYNSFFYDSDKSAFADFRDLGLMVGVGGLAGFQVVAIKQLDAFPFFGALVGVSLLGQLIELSLYDTIEGASLYDEHPTGVDIMASVGIGSLVVCGQVLGKAVASDSNNAAHSRKEFLTWGACLAAVGMGVVEAVRESVYTDESLKNPVRFSGFSMGLLAMSGVQSLGVKIVNKTSYPYFSFGCQVLSASLSFGLNLQLTKGDSLFEDERADLVYRATLGTSLKIAGCMLGLDYRATLIALLKTARFMVGLDQAVTEGNEAEFISGVCMVPTEGTPLLSRV